MIKNRQNRNMQEKQKTKILNRKEFLKRTLREIEKAEFESSSLNEAQLTYLHKILEKGD